MKSFITYQLIIFSIICVKLNSQNLAVLDIAPINYDHDYSLKISKHIRNIIKNNINIKIMDIEKISNILDREDIDNKWCADKWCSREIGKLININQIFSSSIEKNGEKLNIFGMIYDVEKDTILRQYNYLFFEEKNYLLTEIEVMIYNLFDKDLPQELTVQHEYIHQRSQALLGITEKKNKKNATIRSVIFPGLGHRYLNKKPLSNIFFIAQSFFMTNIFYNYFQYRQTSNFYNDLKNNYNNSDNNDEIQNLRNKINKEHISLKSYVNKRKVFTNYMIGFWIFNIYHTRKNSPTTIEILEEIDKNFSYNNLIINKINQKTIDE